jgi:hypothetical protein
MRRGLVALLLALALVVGAAGAAAAQDPGGEGQRSVDGSRAPTDEPLPTPHIIPRPNEGHKPIDSGDRGGSLQFLVLGLMVVAVAGGTAYVVHESRKARERTSADLG